MGYLSVKATVDIDATLANAHDQTSIIDSRHELRTEIGYVAVPGTD